MRAVSAGSGRATVLAKNIVQSALNLLPVCFFGGVCDGVLVSVRACCKTCKIFNDCMHAIFHIFSIRRVAQLRLRLLRCVATTKNNKAIKHLFEIC